MFFRLQGFQRAGGAGGIVESQGRHAVVADDRPQGFQIGNHFLFERNPVVKDKGHQGNNQGQGLMPMTRAMILFRMDFCFEKRGLQDFRYGAP